MGAVLSFYSRKLISHCAFRGSFAHRKTLFLHGVFVLVQKQPEKDHEPIPFNDLSPRFCASFARQEKTPMEPCAANSLEHNARALEQHSNTCRIPNPKPCKLKPKGNRLCLLVVRRDYLRDLFIPPLPSACVPRNKTVVTMFLVHSMPAFLQFSVQGLGLTLNPKPKP